MLGWRAEKLWSPLFICVVIAAYWMIFGWSPPWGGKDEITTYSVLCMANAKSGYGTYVDGNCSGNEAIGNPITYRIDRANKEVVYVGFDDRVASLNNCIIYDSENWECDGRFGGHLSIVDGLRSPAIENGFVPIRSVRGWEYRLIMIEGWLR